MDEGRRGPGGIPTVNVVVATDLIAGVIIAFVPLVDGPRCTTSNFYGPFEEWDVHDLNNPCRVCGDRRKASLLKTWTHRPIEKKRAIRNGILPGPSDSN